MVGPVDPFGGGQFDFFDSPPGLAGKLADASEAFKPPRTALVDYPPGSPCGRVADPTHQRDTLRAVLGVPLNVATRQVLQVPLTYQIDGGEDWVQQTLRLYRGRRERRNERCGGTWQNRVAGRP